jgi:hypothetical protein
MARVDQPYGINGSADGAPSRAVPLQTHGPSR